MASAFSFAGDAARHSDIAFGFTIPGRHARGRLVRLGPTLDAILANHAYPPPIARLLGEALALTALFGAMLKDTAGQLTLQAQAKGGAVDLLVCDYRAGEVRGYVQHDAEAVAALPDTSTLPDLFGEGYLAITFDQTATAERYQGIVPLEGASLAEAAESYFAQSEQIPSLVRIVFEDRGPAGHVAAGLLIQHLPEGEEGRERLHTRLEHPEWEHVAIMGGSVRDRELTDETLPLEELVWRLFHEEAEVRVSGTAPLTRGCRCSVDHIRDVIGRFPEDERREMAEADGMIRVDCRFCARIFPIAA